MTDEYSRFSFEQTEGFDECVRVHWRGRLRACRQSIVEGEILLRGDKLMGVYLKEGVDYELERLRYRVAELEWEAGREE